MLRGLLCLHMAIFILKKVFHIIAISSECACVPFILCGAQCILLVTLVRFHFVCDERILLTLILLLFFSLLFIFIAFVVCSSNSFSVVLFAHFFLLFPSFSFTYNMICLVVLLLVTRILHITFILFITHIYTCTQTPYESLSRLTGKRCMLSIRPVLSSEAPFRVIISLKNMQPQNV